MRSVELNFVRNQDKSLILPELVFYEANGGNGQYYSPQKQEVQIGDKYYQLDSGLIQISPENPETFAATLAHEWRHHWQWLHGMGKFFVDSGGWIKHSNRFSSYDRALREYFFGCPMEMDALRFQRRKGVVDWYMLDAMKDDLP